MVGVLILDAYNGSIERMGKFKNNHNIPQYKDENDIYYDQIIAFTDNIDTKVKNLDWQKRTSFLHLKQLAKRTLRQNI